MKVEMEMEAEAALEVTEAGAVPESEPVDSSAAEGESIPKLTSECPPPPFYYKLFSSAHKDIHGEPVAPPRLQDLDTTGLEAEDVAQAQGPLAAADALQRLALRKKLYGGTVNKGHQQHQYDSRTDYKEVLLGGLEGILQVSLALASEVPPQQTPEVVVLRLHEGLQKIHDTLGQYRHHEGRERLLALRRKEIQELEELATAMDALLDEPLPS